MVVKLPQISDKRYHLQPKEFAMAVYHMVWMKFHDGVDDEAVTRHMDNLAAMAEHIEVIRSVHVGENFTDRARGFTHGLIVEVDTREDLPTYLQHPHHVEIATPLKEDAELMAMDIED